MFGASNAAPSNDTAQLPKTLAVNVCPAIVAVRLLLDVVVLGAAVTLTCIVPVPDAGDTVRPGLVLLAVHAAGAHPAGSALTVTSCGPPVGPHCPEFGVSENVHATLTEIVCCPVRPVTLAVITALPAATAVRVPPATETFDASDVDHCADAVRSSVWLLVKVTLAVQCAC